MDIKNIVYRNKIIGLLILSCVISFFFAFALTGNISETNASAAPSVAQLVPESFSDIAKKARPSVVNISTTQVIKSRTFVQRPFQSPFGDNDPFGEFFERFFGDRMPREDQRTTSLGSGLILDKEGYILTNNHMVESAHEIKVIFSDKREFKAEIIGRDPKTDIALIKIEGAKDLEPLTLGDSEKLEVGDWVVAIGNPYGLENTVTAGIVSAKYRQIGTSSYDNYIQTDASINRGNSGGPLLNTKGEVIGINTAIFSRTGENIGIGFAIPINTAKDLLPQLKKGKVVRAWLGVIIQSITQDLKDALNLKDIKGALVADVIKDGPAEKAGFKRGDVIVAFDGKEIKESNDLPLIVSTTPVGEKVHVDILRDGKKMTLQAKLGELPEEEELAIAGRETPSGPSLGMSVQELNPELARRYGITDTEGLIIVRVDANSAAYEANLRVGDVIIEVDKEPMKDIGQYNRKIERYKAGDTILFLVKREGSTLYLTLKVWE
jgi:serine protease Do